MITFAKKEMIPELKHIWKVCFEDEDAYIDFYFNRRFSESNVLVYCLRGKAVSMLSLLPAAVFTESKEVRVRYIYAVATLPEYRKNGYGSLLLSHTLDLLKSKGEYGILVPANAGLVSFYERRGFVKSFNIIKYETDITQGVKTAEEQKEEKPLLCDISAKEYKALRDACFMREGYVCWDEAAIAYAMDENIIGGGLCKKVIFRQKAYGMIFYINKEEGRLYVKEITAKGEIARVLTREMIKQYGLKDGEANLAVTKHFKAQKQGFAMGDANLPLSDFSYFNLTLG